MSDEQTTDPYAGLQLQRRPLPVCTSTRDLAPCFRHFVTRVRQTSQGFCLSGTESGYAPDFDAKIQSDPGRQRIQKVKEAHEL